MRLGWREKGRTLLPGPALVHPRMAPLRLRRSNHRHTPGMTASRLQRFRRHGILSGGCGRHLRPRFRGMCLRRRSAAVADGGMRANRNWSRQPLGSGGIIHLGRGRFNTSTGFPITNSETVRPMHCASDRSVPRCRGRGFTARGGHAFSSKIHAPFAARTNRNRSSFGRNL